MRMFAARKNKRIFLLEVQKKFWRNHRAISERRVIPRVILYVYNSDGDSCKARACRMYIGSMRGVVLRVVQGNGRGGRGKSEDARV